MSPLSLRRFMERQKFEPRRKHPYRSDSKPRGKVQCSNCLAVSNRGRWEPATEALRLPGAYRELCPACRQSKEGYAEGVVEIHGTSWRSQTDIILKTLRDTEAIARSRNDQERILWFRNFRGVMKVYVTLPELARQMGRILRRSFKGVVKYEPSKEQPFLRVVWQSDEPSAVPKRRTSRAGRSRSRK